MDPMPIELSELEKCFEQVMGLARSHGFDQVELGEKDLYWQVLSDRWEFDRDPDVAVGSLVDDVAELKRLSVGEIPPTSVDLDRLASLLTLLSEQISGVP